MTSDEIEQKVIATAEAVERVETLLKDILAKVDMVVENVGPLVDQVANSPILAMLGGSKKKR